MRVLVVEPIGAHKALAAFFLRCLSSASIEVTFVCPESFLDFQEGRLCEIPKRLFRKKGKLGSRIDASLVLIFIQKSMELDTFDAILFLTYETITFSVFWPKNITTLVLEHNNLDNCLGSRVKEFFYSRLGDSVFHLTFETYISERIETKFGARVETILHPTICGVENSKNRTQLLQAQGVGESTKLIFSPSASTPERYTKALCSLSESANGEFYFLAKGPNPRVGLNWKICRYFQNFDSLLAASDAAFLGKNYEYRVSGIVYEALGVGTHIIMPDCLFGRCMKKKYPTEISLYRKISDVRRVIQQLPKGQRPSSSFLEIHSKEEISKQLLNTVCKIK